MPLSDRKNSSPPNPDPATEPAAFPAAVPVAAPAREIGGPPGLEPTRFGDWEKNGRCVDF